jgi:hypothetical protein
MKPAAKYISPLLTSLSYGSGLANQEIPPQQQALTDKCYAGATTQMAHFFYSLHLLF